MSSETAMRKACHLANAVGQSPNLYSREHIIGHTFDPALKALARVLQEHSDVAKRVMQWLNDEAPDDPRGELQALILPNDEPDPFDAVWHLFVGPKNEARAKVEAAGYQIIKKEG